MSWWVQWNHKCPLRRMNEAEERERCKDATLLDSKVENVSMSQGVQVATERWKREESGLSLKADRGTES